MPSPLEPDAGAPPGGSAPAPEAPSTQQGLLIWTMAIAIGSLLSVLLGHGEAAIFFAGAGLLALAQASDASIAPDSIRQWARELLPDPGAAGTIVRVLLSAIVPGFGALTYVGIGVYASQLGDSAAFRFAEYWSYGAAAVAVLLIAHPVADPVAALLFRDGREVGRTRRLAARLVVLGLLLPPPMQALQPQLLEAMRQSPTPLAEAGGLVSQLAGEIAVTLAGVGWLVRRRTRATAERLGLGPIRVEHLPWIVLGFVGAVGINAGMEALQQSVFPALHELDKQATQIIAADIPVATALVLGLSAGVGEEVMLRGALQPRLGILLTAVLFACGHVQYTWFGMVTIALLGVLLGVVRARSNTTTAIVVHALYDVFAVLTSQS